MKKTILLSFILCFYDYGVSQVVAKQVQQIKVKFNNKDTFLNHVKSASVQTNIKIDIDRKSLAKHGITVNEKIYMDNTVEYELEEALNILTNKLSHTNPGKVFWAKTVSGDIMIFGNP